MGRADSVLVNWKKPLSISLLILAITVIVYYRTCGQSCSFLKGDVFAIDLAYVGITFCGLLIVVNLLGSDRLNTVFLSWAMGTEAYLIRFQVRSGVYQWGLRRPLTGQSPASLPRLAPVGR